MNTSSDTRDYHWFSHPITGNMLAVGAGLAFMLVCMVLPLVGPAGHAVAWADKNTPAFSGALAVALTLSLLSVASKHFRRRVDASGMPVGSLVLAVLCLGILLSLVTGLLSI